MGKIDDLIKQIDNKEDTNNKGLFLYYTRRWPWFVIFCMVGIMAGYFIYKSSPNNFQITSRILVKNEPEELSSVLAFNNSRINDDKKSLIANQIGLLKSYTLYRKALENLNWRFSWYQKKLMYNLDLYNSPPFELEISPEAVNARNIPIQISLINENEYNISIEGETYLNNFPQDIAINKTLKFGEPFKNEFFNFKLKKGNVSSEETFILVFNNLDKITTEYLTKTVIYAEDENSDIITIMIEGQQRQREADFINELNQVLIEFGMENKYASSESSVSFIDSQLERLKNSLSTAEENVSTYRRNNSVMDLGQEAQSVSTTIQQIEQDQYLTQLQIDYYKDLQEYINDAKKMEEMVNPSIIGITDSNLEGLLSTLMDLYSKREVLSYSVQDKNPKLILAEKEIIDARDRLEEMLKNQLEATISKMKSLNERYKTMEQRLKQLPETERNLISIEREFDLNNEIYTYMLQKKTEASISKASIVPEVQIIDKAIVEAAKQTGPNLILNIAAGLIGGGIIPFIFITLIIVFNNKIESLNEVENQTRIPVFEGIMRHKYKENLPVIIHPRSGIAENFRGLKTNIATILKDNDSIVISINSLVPGEGKSFISSNLSAAISKTNKKVLLIGSDLHKPTLHNYLNIKESYGLSNYLNEEKSLEDIISATPIPNLYFIQTGTFTGNPSDLLDNTKFEELIKQTRKMFNYVIIDNAPLMLIPDAIITSKFSDLSLFILRINYSHKDQIKQLNKIIDFNGIEKAAIVVNDTPESSYGYGYGHRKKYWKKGYGDFKT